MKQLIGVMRKYAVVLKYALGLGLLTWVVWSNWHISSDGEEVGLATAWQRPIHFTALLLAGVLCLAGVLLSFVRWFILVRAQDLPFTLTNAFRLGLVGFFFSAFLPGSVGGDIVKAACLAREQSRRTVAVATVLLDRVLGLCGLIWLVALLGGVFWMSGELAGLAVSDAAFTAVTGIVLVAWGLLGASVLFWLVLVALPVRWADSFAQRLRGVPRVGGLLAEFWSAVWMYRCRGRSVGQALALALIGHFGFVLAFYFAAQTLAPVERIPGLQAHFVLVPVGKTFEAGFPSPNGVGGGEYGFGWLYAVLGSTFALGVLGCLVDRVIRWLLGFAGYLVYLRMRPALDGGRPLEPAAVRGEQPAGVA